MPKHQQQRTFDLKMRLSGAHSPTWRVSSEANCSLWHSRREDTNLSTRQACCEGKPLPPLLRSLRGVGGTSPAVPAVPPELPAAPAAPGEANEKLSLERGSAELRECWLLPPLWLLLPQEQGLPPALPPLLLLPQLLVLQLLLLGCTAAWPATAASCNSCSCCWRCAA
jgi:hypothetical protein